MSRTRTGAPPRTVELKLNGETVEAKEDQTILEVAKEQGIDIPTMCWESTLTPVNACRVCVVEVKDARVLVPSCARRVEDDMDIQTHSERVNHSRKMVLEFLASSVDLSVMPDAARWIEEYGADPERYGPPAPPFEAGERDRLRAGHHETPDGRHAATVHQPVKVDNELYVRDYSKCILCYKCVEGCGTDWQNTFAIAVAGRGFDARIATEFAAPLPDSACVYCGNCIAVCPTGALMFKSEHDLREEGDWDESRQTTTTTICTYCGVGCNLELHEQDNEIVKVTSPLDHPVTRGNLCIKGRFGFQFIQNHDEEEPPDFLDILDGKGGRKRRRRATARRRRTDMPEADDSELRLPVAGADGWRYLPFRLDERTFEHEITLVRDEDGEQVRFTMPAFVEQGDELGEIALLVIRARERWRELKGVGG